MKDCVVMPGRPMLCPCGSPVQPLHIAFQGADGNQLNISLTSEDLLMPAPAIIIRQGQYTPACSLGIMVGPPALNFWILGDVFLRKVYAVHDVFGRRVMLFSHGSVGGQAHPIVAANGETFAAGILAERAWGLLFLTVLAFSSTFAAC